VNTQINKLDESFPDHNQQNDGKTSIWNDIDSKAFKQYENKLATELTGMSLKDEDERLVR